MSERVPDISNEEVCTACGGDRYLRRPPIIGGHVICAPCMIVWYDGCDDPTNPESVGRESMRCKAEGKYPWDAKTLANYDKKEVAWCPTI